MQTKYRIDRDTRTLILKYIRKYDEYKTWYECERDKILYLCLKLQDGMPGNTNISNPTLSAVEALEKLEKKHKSVVLRVIDQARHLIGIDVMQSQEQENTLRRAIWLSCINAKEYPFEVFEGVVACERAQFYRYKNQFLNEIKNNLGL